MKLVKFEIRCRHLQHSGTPTVNGIRSSAENVLQSTCAGCTKLKQTRGVGLHAGFEAVVRLPKRRRDGGSGTPIPAPSVAFRIEQNHALSRQTAAEQRVNRCQASQAGAEHDDVGSGVGLRRRIIRGGFGQDSMVIAQCAQAQRNIGP